MTELPEPLYNKGHEFKTPSGVVGYILNRDAYLNIPIMAEDFDPMPGFPDPKPGRLVPSWLGDLLSKTRS